MPHQGGGIARDVVPADGLGAGSPSSHVARDRVKAKDVVAEEHFKQRQEEEEEEQVLEKA